MTGAQTYTAEERSLLIEHFRALHSTRIREFMRAFELGPLSGAKDQLVAIVAEALRSGSPTWPDLVGYLDRVEPWGKQHVYLFEVDQDAFADWGDANSVQQALAARDLESLWQSQRAIAAPEKMQLSAVTLEDGELEIAAISRRSYPVRRKDLEKDLIDRPGFEARVYEDVKVRAWVRLRLQPDAGTASLHLSQLQRKADYEGVRDEFLELIAPWFPVDGLKSLDLAKVIGRLQDSYREHDEEARPQSLQYLSYGGVRSSLSSATGGQAVLGESDELDEAAQTLRESGPGAGGNFYFLPPPAGDAANPLTEETHLRIVVREHRVNFPRPTDSDSLRYVLRRLRVLSG